MALAIVMAGGRSSRMRATYGPAHKALVEVLGISMLERNLRALSWFGFDDWRIAIAADEPELAEFVRTQAAELAASLGATIRTVIEREPHGTIGAVRNLGLAHGSLLVVNVDNLTALDLRAFVAAHETSGAALTVAVHRETFTMPFGEVHVEDGAIVEYLEKPSFTYEISSGTYVLGEAARAAVPSDRPMGLPELIGVLRSRGHRIGAYLHDAPWIDVNDAESIKRAEALISRHADRFAFHGAAR